MYLGILQQFEGKGKLYRFTLLVLLLFVRCGNAQEEYQTLSAEDKLTLRVQSYVLVDLNDVLLPILQPILDEKIPIAVRFSYENKINLAFIQAYQHYKKPLIVVSDSKIDELLLNEITVIQVKSKDIETIDLTLPRGSDNNLIRFNGLQEFGHIKYANIKGVTDTLIYDIWKNSGKLPNFIQTKSDGLSSVKRIVTTFNAQRKLFGIVKTEDGMLSQVSFKNSKNAKASGYFSFPIPTDGIKPILTPHKAGYYFSPDIIYITPENQNNLKEFIGFPLDTEFGLSDYFVFGNKIKNTIRNNDAEIIINNVSFKNDVHRGKVGFFKDRAYIDAGISSKIALKSSFTITAWVKPTAIDANNSIVGKGEGFVLKIHNGFLTFTIAGIKDYVSESSPIPMNKWSHIALVHSKVDQDLHFFVNGEETERVELIADYVTSDYNLLIGSNLWEEFFVGYLDDIKIWERELNGNEIKIQYTKIPSEGDTKLIWSGVVLTAILIGFFTFQFFRKKKMQSEAKGKTGFPSVVFSDLNKTIHNNFKVQLLCFGALRILNEEGIDVAKKLSPLLKKMFSIVFLHSYGNKKGISTKKLTELLWPGMTVQSAKNTRGTNIQNLRTILNTTSEIKLIFKDKHWSLELSDQCYCDYHTALNYLNYFTDNTYSLLSLESELPKLLDILRKGRFFNCTSSPWLDPYVEKFSNLVIERCSLFSEKLDIETHGDLLFGIAEVIYIYDDLNEHALQIKLNVLIKQGKFSLAHTVYDNFAKLYQKLYKEKYSISFEDMFSEHQSPL